MPAFHSHQPQVPWLAPATSWVFHALEPSQVTHFCNSSIGGLGRTPSHSPPTNSKLIPGGSRWPPAAIPVVPLNWDLQWLLHLLWILNSSGKGGTQSREHDNPPVAPSSASSFIPWICIYSSPCFWKGLMFLTSSWWGGSSAILSLPLLIGDTQQGGNVLHLITQVKQSWAQLIHGWVTILLALLHSAIHD